MYKGSSGNAKERSENSDEIFVKQVMRANALDLKSLLAELCCLNSAIIPTKPI